MLFKLTVGHQVAYGSRVECVTYARSIARRYTAEDLDIHVYRATSTEVVWYENLCRHLDLDEGWERAEDFRAIDDWLWGCYSH